MPNKLSWDLAQSLVWNSRNKLIGIFKEFLPNPRDVIPVVRAITSFRGWVKSTREAIQAPLEPLDTPRSQAAQIQLCRTLKEWKKPRKFQRIGLNQALSPRMLEGSGLR